MSEEQKIIDLENEIIFLKDVLSEQQKEIEEYKEHYENMKWYYDNQKDNLIHKDKIRELIKKYRILNNGQIEGLYNKEILALQELLEEN